MAREHKQARRKSYQADVTTGLQSRNAFNDASRELEQHGVSYIVMIIDIDHFKRINDTKGHEAGDVVLRSLAKLAEKLVCRYDGAQVFRWGGEEFAALFPGYTTEEVSALAEHIRHQLSDAKCIIADGEELKMPTVTIGIAGPPESTSSHSFTNADTALRIGKQNGRNQTVLFTSVLARRDARRLILNPQLFTGIGKSLRIIFLHIDRYHHASALVEASKAPFKCVSVLGPYDILLVHFAKSERQFNADLKEFVKSVGHDVDYYGKYSRYFFASRILKFHGVVVAPGEVTVERRVLRQLVNAARSDILPRSSVRQRWTAKGYLLKTEGREARDGEIEAYMTISLNLPPDAEGGPTDYVVETFLDTHILNDPRIFSLYEGHGTIGNVRFVARTRCSERELFGLIEDLHRHAESATLRAHTGTYVIIGCKADRLYEGLLTIE